MYELEKKINLLQLQIILILGICIISFIPTVFADHITTMTFTEPKALSHYQFDNDTKDYGMLKNDGMLLDSVHYEEGKIANSLVFDGNISVHIKNLDELNSPSFSISFWVNPNQLRTQGIVHKFSDDGNTGWRIFMNQAHNIEFDAVHEVANIQTHPILFPNQWHLITVTYDMNTQIAKIYQNGELVVQAFHVDMQNTHPSDIIIGSLDDNRLDGKLDDVKFYNKTLSGSEVSFLYYGFFQPLFLVIIILIIGTPTIFILYKKNIIVKSENLKKN